jgi:flagellar biosynthetic protein FlhB
MAFGDDQGRTEKPTPGRLAEVRNRGDTHLSRELLTGATLLTAAIALRSLGGWLLQSLGAALQHGLTLDMEAHPVRNGDVPGACQEVLITLALVAAPSIVLLAVLLLAAAVAGYAQIGVHIADEVMQLKLERLNPASNYKRLFSMQAIVRTVFALIKLGVLVAVLTIVLKSRWADLTKRPDQDFAVAMHIVADIAMTALLWVAVVVFVLAIADVFWQRFDFEKRNMMTKQEIEDERKRGEGDPMVKNRLRQARTELLRHRMMQAVPKADVVITNPTHYAVALRYDRKKNAAPEVIAKGVDEMAARIREIARENKVPLMEDPPLARALFRAVKVGQEIPARFFEAVATVLSHVYRLKNRVA